MLIQCCLVRVLQQHLPLQALRAITVIFTLALHQQLHSKLSDDRVAKVAGSKRCKGLRFKGAERNAKQGYAIHGLRGRQVEEAGTWFYLRRSKALHTRRWLNQLYM
jgi:hypothetical protein